MPKIAEFYGIIIRMYFQQAEHNPPHIHALYGGNTAEFDIQTGEILDGELPPKAVSMVNEWMDIHRSELIEMWDTQDFKQLEPLE